MKLKILACLCLTCLVTLTATADDRRHHDDARRHTPSEGARSPEVGGNAVDIRSITDQRGRTYPTLRRTPLKRRFR